MALSYTNYTGDGSTTDFNVVFDYIARAHVLVLLDGVETTDFTWLSDTQIRLDVAPSNAVVVKVKRSTPNDARLVDFSNGSVLNADTDLDVDSNQLFFIAQEGIDNNTDAVVPDGSIGSDKLQDLIATGGTTARDLRDRFADVFNVKDYGAVGDGITDDTAAIRLAAAALDAANCGTLFFPAGTYKVFSATTGALCEFTGCDGIQMLGYGATLQVPEDKVITASEGYFFYFSDCKNITVDGFTTGGPELDVSTTTVKGYEFVRCVNGCRNINMPNNRVVNSLSGFISSKALADPDSMRTQNVHIGVLDVVNCWYGINGQYSGDFTKCDLLRTDTVHRSAFYYGASNLDITVWSKDCVGSSDCPITASHGIAVENVRLNYHSSIDSIACGVGPKVKIGFSGQDASLMRNIHINLNLRYNATGNTGGCAVMIEKLTDAGAPDATDRGHQMQNLVITGTIEGTPSYNNGGIIVTDTLGTWGTGDYFSNISLENLRINSPMAVVMSLGNCTDNVLLKNVYSAGALAIRHDATATRIPRVSRLLLDNVQCTNRWIFDGTYQPIENIRGTGSPQTAYAGWSGHTITNIGVGGNVEWDLPAAVVGLELTFARVAAFVMDLDPNGSEVIRGGTAGQLLRMNSDGNMVKLVCYVDGTWEVVHSQGSYSFV